MYSSSEEGLEAMKMGQINALTFLRLFWSRAAAGGHQAAAGQREPQRVIITHDKIYSD